MNAKKRKSDMGAEAEELLRKGYQASLELIDDMEQLSQFQDKIETPYDIGMVWRVFLDDVRKLIDVETCALFLVDEDSHEFILRSVSPEDKGPVCQKEIDSQIESGMFSSIINRRQPAITHPLTFQNKRTILLLPLCTIKSTPGMVLILSPIEESSITQENMRLLKMLTRQCSLVMENSLLYENLMEKNAYLEQANKEIMVLSKTDPLTGCYNRGHLTDHLPQEIKRAGRYGHHLSLIMCDIDHFKKINDQYGHQAGDLVLKEFVNHIMDLIRSDIDWLARYGGEEFLIILPETDYKGACRQAKRLCSHISRMVVEAEGKEIRITASFGVTGFTLDYPDEGISPETLIGAADKYLYQAKKQGRNRVVSGLFAH